jgi:mono/diheme cytochrome c family protein
MKALTKSEPIENEGQLLLDHDYDGIKELYNNLPPWWVYLFYACIAFAIIYLVRFEILGADNQEMELKKEMAQAKFEVAEYMKTAPDLMDEKTVTLLTDAPSLAEGKTIFTTNCAACHRADAGGQIGPNLTDDLWILGGGIKNIFHTLVNGGRDGKGMISWKGTLKLDGGTLYTQFSHFIDLLYWMVGDVKRAYALTGNFAHNDIIEFEDTGVVALEFYSGTIGSIHYTVNSYQKNMEGSLTIFAEKGTVKVGGQYLNELEYQCIKDFEFRDLPAGNNANNYGDYKGSMSNHDKVYENLIDVLNSNASISANSFEGLKTVEIIDKIYASAKVLNNG